MGKCWALNADGSVCGADSLGYCDPKEWPPQKKYCGDHIPEGGLSRTNAKTVWELERFSVIMFSHFQRARGMMKHGNYDGKWCDSYMAGMATKA